MMNKLGAALLLSLSMFGIVGCGSAIVMTPDSTVPFALGEIDVVAGDGPNGNGSYTVRVEHLGDPGKLDASATTYIVWIKTNKDDAKETNMGALSVDSSQSGKVSFTTPFKEFEVTVTAEPATDAAQPSGRVLLKAEVDVD
jgi:hypothetical protein